ncbi:nucleotide exchange factor GrpE [Shimazuella sp. AN120528]|uniref:nucleotide exchange factor GrpE n=1 Tax=Shimazuella soli TaxID=1892854 RepID=UPI001F0DD898|nr:nucleotide exchange factor GrpE [Shimazuella soli]MCH5583846.1 nucleotide exchange factor GrpE [Shimazuella soli]
MEEKQKVEDAEENVLHVDEDASKPSRDELDSLQNELAMLKEKNAQLESELAESKNQLARSVADLENARRRARKEKEDAVKYASVPLVESLLPVLDNFERALDAAEVKAEDRGLLDGVEMVYRQLLQALSDAGLSLVEAVGVPFDPHVHNAVMQVESSDHESGIVIEELQSGYRFRDRVIRPTMVKVST